MTNIKFLTLPILKGTEKDLFCLMFVTNLALHRFVALYLYFFGPQPSRVAHPLNTTNAAQHLKQGLWFWQTP
jgi:hypothetical protein